ncbi:MAG TPA: NAD(P)(+) transhydrogenase (Re/Si-specific) subunit beta, partial [Candidatus Limnocylindrales bacterium]
MSPETLALIESFVRLAWLIGAAGFVLGLMQMNSPATARTGNLVSAGGMAIAIGGTAVLLAARGEAGIGAWIIILAGIAVGGGLGLYTARTVKMTAMPQLVSLFNAVGGGAAALIAIDDYIRLARLQALLPNSIPLEISIPTVLDIVIGGITFTGSLIASGKLMGI